MFYENQDGLYVEWNGKHTRFNEKKEIPSQNLKDLDGIDFAMWDCEPTTFTYKDLEVTMVAYNTDCAEKDKAIVEKEKIISDQTGIVKKQNMKLRELLNKNKLLEEKIKTLVK